MNEDAAWNAALLALGREWRRQLMCYAPEEDHEIDKAIYALWRGDGLGDDRGDQPENEKVCDAIAEGLERRRSWTTDRRGTGLR